ncbi:hypothetical protein JXA70_01085 [candidate division KSB1 bacterium]|nr:hypothetical protein [candidate division KSB1 bacterium]
MIRKYIFYIVLALFSSSALRSEPSQKFLADALQADYSAGHISRSEYVAYRLMGIRHIPGLPSRYHGLPQDPSRMGTSLMMEARALVDQSQGVEKKLLQTVLYRPDSLLLSQTSPSGLFKLHYTNKGYDAADDSFISRSARAYDEVYDIIIHELGYDPPPIDDPQEPEYDVYVYALGGYGMSTPESSAALEKYPNGYTSYISMDNTFDKTYTKGIDGMLVTAAHEFFHMVQMGMRIFSVRDFDSRFLFEGTATWMEDYAYEEINDYLQYLPSYMRNLSNSFNTFNGLHEYGSCLFYHMLEAKYGADIIKSIWIEFARHGVWNGFENAMHQYDSTFKKEIIEHMIWNYFTDVRAQPDTYYPEGVLYPLVESDYIREIEEKEDFSEELAYLSAHYIKLEPATIGDLMLRSQIPLPAHWHYAVIEDSGHVKIDTKTLTGSSNLLLPKVNPANTLVLIPTNTFLSDNGATREYDEYSFFISLGQRDDIVAGIQSIYPNPFHPALHSQGVRVNVRLTQKTDQITYHIVNEAGMVVYSSTVQYDAPLKGDLPLFWDGTNSQGDLVSSGIYIIYVDTNQDIQPAKIAVVQ